MSRDQVDRWVELGEIGRARMRMGEYAAAETAFVAQLAISSINPEPHVSLALIAALRDDSKGALARLRAAVVRGFTDLGRIERAEAWTGVGRGHDFSGLQEAVVLIQEAERKWAGFEMFKALSPPASLTEALRLHAQRAERVEQMAAALGPRQTALWQRINGRATASLLERYVMARPEAADLGEAFDRLMKLYAGPSLMRWERLSPEAARRLGAVAARALERFPQSPLRPGALACNALAAYATRDRRGALTEEATSAVFTSLDEILDRHADSLFALVAVEGLVRTALETDQQERATASFAKFRARHAADPQRLDEARERLGTLALWAGGLPDFRALALDGTAVESRELDGKITIIDFWATWCPPCVEEFSTLRRIGSRHGEDVVILGVSLDDGEELTAEELTAWVEKQGLPGRHLFDGRGWASELVRTFGVKEIPFSVVVGRDGKVLAVAEKGRRLEKAVELAAR